MEHDANTRTRANDANAANERFARAHSRWRSSFRTEARYSGAGFTVVEILVALAVAGIVALIVTGSFSKAVPREALDKETGIVISLLDQARNQTLSSKKAAVYGVHFESAKAVLFTGSAYSGLDPSNVIEPLNSLVKIASTSLSGGGSEVIFKRLTGETAQSGTVTLSLVADASQTKTITVFGTGLAQSN